MNKTATVQIELAERIVNELVSHELIPKSHEEQALKKIASGKARAEDWLLWVELATNQDTTHD